MKIGTNIVVKAMDKTGKVFNQVSNKMSVMQKSFGKVNNRFASLQKKNQGLRDGFQKVGGAAQKVGGAMTAGITAPIALFGKSIFDTGLQFETMMNGVEAKAIVTGKSINDLREQAKELGATTKFSAVEAAGAMDFLSMAGWNTQKIFDGLPNILNLAAASGSGIEQAADVASNIMGAFEIDASESQRVADVMTATLTGFNVDLSMLADSMKYASPVAKEFGASLESTAIATGLLGNIGIQGSKAGTAIRAMFSRMAAQPKPVQKAFARLGIEAENSQGKLRPFEDILKDVGNSLGDLSQGEQLKAIKDIFGQEALAGGAGLIRAIKSGAFTEAMKGFENLEGTAERTAKTMEKGIVGAFNGMKSAWEGFKIALSEAGILDALTDIFKDISKTLREVSKANPALIRMAIFFSLIAAAIGPLLLVFGTLISSLASVTVLVNGIIALKGTMAIPFIIMSAKIIALVAAIGILAYAFVEMYRRWDEVKFGFLVVLDEWKFKFAEWINWFKKQFNKLPNFLKARVGLSGVNFDVKSDSQLLVEKDFARRQRLKEVPEYKQSTFEMIKSEFVGMFEMPKAQDSNITVDIKGLPQGSKVDTSGVNSKNVGVNYGFQGATQ